MEDCVKIILKETGLDDLNEAYHNASSGQLPTSD
jgi:hypothetical protein